MIEVENLVKKYGSHMAVDHLSFHVEKGQIYGFLGPNGAGKTTTMNIMTGYQAATEGSVKINGFDILAQPEEAKKCIGYLPEQPPLYQEMTVSEYLHFVSELKRVKKVERNKQIKEVMEMTMIGDVSKRLIRNLSKGYKQRVGLAQAILGYPEVVILDEPTVGLDPKQIIEIRDLIRRLGENHTVILSSHILSEVSAVCDHIMIITNGKLVASDSPEGLKKLQNKTASLEITVLGSKEAVNGALGNIKQIDEIVYSENEEEDALHISVRTASGMDVIRDVGIALMEKKIPVTAMSRQEETLEDIFLELTASEYKSEEEILLEEKLMEEKLMEQNIMKENMPEEREDKKDESNI